MVTKININFQNLFKKLKYLPISNIFIINTKLSFKLLNKINNHKPHQCIFIYNFETQLLNFHDLCYESKSSEIKASGPSVSQGVATAIDSQLFHGAPPT